MTRDAVTLTLPLSEEGILCHAKLVLEVPILHHGLRFSQHMCYLPISSNVLKSNDTSLDHVYIVVAFHLILFRLVMKDIVFLELNATLIV